MLPHYLLTTLADRMEMAHSVEGRVPFLDHHVAEYAAGLPLRHKIRMEPGQPPREKNVLREAVRDYVLPEVYDRQKHPFMSPPARSDDDPSASSARTYSVRPPSSPSRSSTPNECGSSSTTSPPSHLPTGPPAKAPS